MPSKTTKISNIRKSQNLRLFSDRKSICLFPINLDVLLINRYAKSCKRTILKFTRVYNNYMATSEEHLASDDKLKIHQRHFQILAIEMYKTKNKLNPSFMWKTHKEKNIPYSLSHFPLHSKRKHSEIWNKLIKFYRKCFVEQLTRNSINIVLVVMIFTK